MNKVPAGTFRFEVVGEPTTPEDLNVIVWAFGTSYHFNCGDPEMVTAMRHTLPYNQGGGLVRLIKMSAAEAQRITALRSAYTKEDEDRPWAGRTEEVNNLGGLYTGWVLEDFYTDSMTTTYWSPVFEDGSHQDDYITWEM